MQAFKERQFTARYNRIFLFTFIAVILISTALTVIKLRATAEHDRIQLLEQFQSRRLAVDNLIASAKEHVNLLHAHAEGYLLEPGSTESTLFSALAPATLEDTDGGPRLGYALDSVPALYRHSETTGELVINAGNLTGYGDLDTLDPAVEEELRMALSLNKLFVAAKKNIKNSSWVYYTSKNRFINIFPWVSSGDFSFSKELYTHEFYRWGCPETNALWGCDEIRPQIAEIIDEGHDGIIAEGSTLAKLREDENGPFQRMFWTPAYIDEYGQGMMVTAAKPVYRGEDFLGTVAIDVTLDELKEYVKNFGDESGALMIVDETGQLIAHPALVSSKDTRVKPLAHALPEALKGREQLFTQANASNNNQVLSHAAHDYIWTELKNAPWRLIYVTPSKSVFMSLFSAVGVVFLVLLSGLAYLLFATKRLTYREFIFPAESLVRHIDLESKDGPGEVPEVPAPWMPWFDEISKIFAENRTLIAEIKEKNEMLTEMNVSLERYMPKFILLMHFSAGSGSTSAGQLFAHSLHAKDSEKPTVYLEYPDPGTLADEMKLGRGEHIHKHPNGYDIWTDYDLGVAPEEARSSLLMTKILNQYNNIVINATIPDSIDACIEDLSPMFPYCKAIVIVPPADGSETQRVQQVTGAIRRHVRQDKVNVYTLVNNVSAEDRCPETYDFDVPYCAGFELGGGRFDPPAPALEVIDSLVDRIERVHQLSVFIPTTVDVNQEIDADAYVNRTMVFLGEKFGGATSTQAKGVWNSEEVGIVDEVVHMVLSYTTEDDLSRYMDDVVAYVRGLKEELSQEAMAIEVNKKMILV